MLICWYLRVAQHNELKGGKFHTLLDVQCCDLAEETKNKLEGNKYIFVMQDKCWIEDRSLIG